MTGEEIEKTLRNIQNDNREPRSIKLVIDVIRVHSRKMSGLFTLSELKQQQINTLLERIERLESLVQTLQPPVPPTHDIPT